MGSSLPVCIRCASIYFGFTLSAILGIKPRPRLVQFALALNLLEFFVALTFLDSGAIRAAVGVILGAGIAPFVYTGVGEMLETARHAHMRKELHG